MLSELHVEALLLAAKNRLMIQRQWLVDAMAVTNVRDVEFTYTNPFKIGDKIAVTKEDPKIPALKAGQIVGVNKQFVAACLEDSDTASDQVSVVVLSDNKSPAFKRLDVFKFDLAQVKMIIGVCPLAQFDVGYTTVGRFIENIVCFQYPTNFKVFGYMNAVMGPQDVVKMMTKAVTAKSITVKEYKTFLDYLFFLNQITELCVPSMTEHSLMTNPKVAEFKAKFIAEHKDQMNDPVVIKQLEDALAKLDAEWLGRGTDHEDPAVCFFDGLGSKSYDIHRKKLFLTTGGIPAFNASTGKFDFIPNSLMEGWTIQALPSIANEIRKGSYERGRETAKGGAETKLVMRVFQDLAITNDDCGTKRTISVDFKTTCRAKDFIGRTIQTEHGDVVLDEQNIKEYDGKTVRMYSPLMCATPYDLCYKCCGQRAKQLGAKVLGIQVVNITSKFMLTAMKNMHGTVLKIVQPKLEEVFL